MLRRRFLFGLILGTAALLLATPAPQAQGESGSLAGRLIVARPGMPDRNFAQTVILIVEHSRDGAFGLVINRPFGTGSLAALLTAFGVDEPASTDRAVRLYSGGPVERGRGFFLHSTDYQDTSTRSLNGQLALSTGPEILRTLADGGGPRELLLLIGYAGWGRGQLDREIESSDWLIAPADAGLIFSAEPRTIWERALKTAGIPL